MEKFNCIKGSNFEDRMHTQGSSSDVIIKQKDTCLSTGQLSTSTPTNILRKTLEKSTSHLFVDNFHVTKIYNKIVKESDEVRIFNTNTMTSETYLRRARALSNDMNQFNEGTKNNLRFSVKNGAMESFQPCSINTMHLKNSYRTSEKFHDYGYRSNDASQLPSDFRQKTFRSDKSDMPVRRNMLVHEKYGNGRLRSCWEKMQNSQFIEQYCANTSLHGLRYVGDRSLSLIEKLFWIIAFVCAFLSATYFIWHLYNKWQDSPIIISMSPEPVTFSEFPFPSITICNMNNANKKEAQRINKGNNNVEKLLLEDICNLGNTTSDNEVYGSADWSNVLHFMLNVSQPCEELLRFCHWHRAVAECQHIFNPVMTDEGLCCNFNAVHRKYLFYNPSEWSDLNITFPYETIDWKPETGYNDSVEPDTQPWRPYGAGKSLGLTVVLDAKLEQYYCSSTASVGFKLLLHSPVETPKIADFGLAISPGKETHVIITPRISSASWSILALPRRKRKCFFTTERKLKYYRTYTERNCLLECEANFTRKICHCVQYYMPKARDTPICGKKDDNCAKDARRLMENNLYDDEDAIDRLNITETPSCNCWPACFETNYETQISHSMLSNRFTIDEVYLNNTDQKYFTENMAVVHLYFVESQFPNLVKSELFGFIEFLSNIGGLLGLFMGFSFLSVVEILYFTTLRVGCRITKGHIKPQHDSSEALPAPKIIYPFSQ